MKRPGQPPFSCLVTRGQATPVNFQSEKAAILETVRQASADGASMVQIREKSLPARMLFDLASAAVETLAKSRMLVLVNDRPDVAIASGADGVHLPENSIPAQVVRAIGRELVIGVSTHSMEQAEAAAASGVDYILFGPVFETPGKGVSIGLGVLKAITDKLGGFPVIALGGIDHNNFRDALAAGAAGVAAIRSLNESESRKLICKGLAAR